jgi:hypothetical protein
MECDGSSVFQGHQKKTCWPHQHQREQIILKCKNLLNFYVLKTICIYAKYDTFLIVKMDALKITMGKSYPLQLVYLIVI